MCLACIAEPTPHTTARAIPGVGTFLLALVPKFGCPLCWPVLAATLGIFGLRVESLNRILLAVAIATLALALLLLLRAKRERTPYLLFSISAAFVLAYRLSLLSAVATYSLAALVAAFFVFHHIRHFTQHAPSGHR